MEYLLNEKQKAFIEKMHRENDKIEEQKREKYNPDNIFKGHITSVAPVKNEPVVTETAMVECKESLFDKIKSWFKSLFVKNK